MRGHFVLKISILNSLFSHPFFIDFKLCKHFETKNGIYKKPKTAKLGRTFTLHKNIMHIIRIINVHSTCIYEFYFHVVLSIARRKIYRITKFKKFLKFIEFF